MSFSRRRFLMGGALVGAAAATGLPTPEVERLWFGLDLSTGEDMSAIAFRHASSIWSAADPAPLDVDALRAFAEQIRPRAEPLEVSREEWAAIVRECEPNMRKVEGAVFPTAFMGLSVVIRSDFPPDRVELRQRYLAAKRHLDEADWRRRNFNEWPDPPDALA